MDAARERERRGIGIHPCFLGAGSPYAVAPYRSIAPRGNGRGIDSAPPVLPELEAKHPPYRSLHLLLEARESPCHLRRDGGAAARGDRRPQGGAARRQRAQAAQVLSALHLRCTRAALEMHEPAFAPHVAAFAPRVTAFEAQGCKGWAPRGEAPGRFRETRAEVEPERAAHRRRGAQIGKPFAARPGAWRHAARSERPGGGKSWPAPCT